MRVILYILALLCVVSCRTTQKTLVAEEKSTDTLFVFISDTVFNTIIKETVRDSIVHDSTIITLSATGDTLKEVIYRDRFVNNNVEKSQSEDKKHILSVVKQSADSSSIVTEVKPKSIIRPKIILSTLFLLLFVIAVYKTVKSFKK